MRKFLHLAFVLMLLMLAACSARGDFGTGSQNYATAELTRDAALAVRQTAEARYQDVLATAAAQVQTQRGTMETFEREFGQILVVGFVAVGVLFMGGIFLVGIVSPFARQELRRETLRLNMEELPALYAKIHKATMDLDHENVKQPPAPLAPPPIVTAPPPYDVVQQAPAYLYVEESTRTDPYRAQATQPAQPATPHARSDSEDDAMTQPSKPQDLPL